MRQDYCPVKRANMYEQTGYQFPQIAFLWPALIAASASEISASVARQFADLASRARTAPAACEPQWATPNTIALELSSVRMRDFSTAQDSVATLLCAPLALHGASVADLAFGHSLVGALRGAGLGRLYVTDWRSATPDMRYLTIDSYLADLNVLVDQLGGTVNLVGLCQGGWMALLYTARFPAKVRKLVIAGAPIDIAAGRSELSTLVDATPSAMFHELVRLGDGRILGRNMLKFWDPGPMSSSEIQQVLQTLNLIGSPTFAGLEAIFRAWHAWTLDLPGTYYLEVVDRLYRRNEIANGAFVALGQRIDLKTVRAPLFLLAANKDLLVAPAQLFAAEQLVGTPKNEIRKELVSCGHAGLFVGRDILTHDWPQIAHWLGQPEAPQITSTH